MESYIPRHILRKLAEEHRWPNDKCPICGTKMPIWYQDKHLQVRHNPFVWIYKEDYGK